MENLTKKRTTAITNTNIEKYLNALNFLKNSLDRDSAFSMQKFIKEYNLNQRLAKVLKDGKIIKNTKVGKYPEWEWVSIKPNVMMSAKVLDELEKIREQEKMRVKAKAKGKQKVSKRKPTQKERNVSVAPTKKKRKYTKRKVLIGYQISFFFGLLKINIKPIYKNK